MNEIVKKRFSVLVMTIVLLMGAIIPGMVALSQGMTSENYETVIQVSIENSEDLNKLKEYGEVIDHYGKIALVRTNEDGQEELANRFEIDLLEDRNTLNVKGHFINTDKYNPELNSELTVDGYEPGTEGMYIVDMIGPVNPEWRQKLEDNGVKIINYVPNYAYEVSMTPEEADDVRGFDFIDWVGVYQPEYKLDPQVDEALENNIPVEIRLNPSSEGLDIKSMVMSHDIVGFENLKDKGSRIIIDADSQEEINALAKRNDVYYISPTIKPELHGEMDIQQIGGGLWFMDDEYDTRTDLDPQPREGDPDKPYRKHGEYGAYMNQIGYTGKGVTVAVADTGIGDGTTGDAGVEDFTGRVVGGYSIGSDEDYWAGGHYHGTACSGLIAGDTYDGTGETWDEYNDGDNPYYMGQGLASDSELFAMKIFDDEGNSMISEYYPIIEEVAQRSDAYIHSNSWGSGTQGSYVTTDEVFDQAVRDSNRDVEGNQPMVITTSAGNDGWMGDQTTGSPGNAKNVITVGGNQPYNPGLGYENPENMYDSSSRGWTEDNRVKPDIIAPGQSVISQNTPLDEEGGDYIAASGTSFSNPLVAGASAIVVDWYEQNYDTTPSPAMVKSILINTANELDPDVGNTRGHIPNKDEGWGVADISKLEYPLEDPMNFMFEDQTSLLTTGEQDEYKITYDKENKPMKITLTWTDKNALDGDSEDGNPTLKNNLDLQIVTPSGETIRGNAFDYSGDGESDDGFTYSNASVMDAFDYDEDGWDDVNNVENVYIPADKLESGVYTIRVKGTNIPADANNDGQANQDYALTSQNAIFPEDGKISMDSDRYSENAQVEFSVVDQDMFEQDTVSIGVHIYDEQNNSVDQMNVTLRGERRGVVTGSVEISPQYDNSDEGLYVEDRYTIEAIYYDDSMGENKFAYAQVDGEPPAAVTDVSTSWLNGDNNISWTLSEDDGSGNFTGYRIYRAESVNGAPGSWELIDTVNPNINEYIDDGKGKDDYTRYWYDVAAVDDVGNENISGVPDIEPPAARLTQPESEEIWTSNQIESIGWYAASGGLNSNVTLEYSTDSGENWTSIVENQDINAGDGNYDWNIPTITGTEFNSLVRITIQDSKGNSSSLSDSFTLSEYQPPSVSVTTPDENTQWYTNSTEDIIWDTTLGDGGSIESVELRYSSDGGNSWSNITTENQDNGSFTWDLPVEPTDKGVISISIEDNNGLYAENVSDQFNIIAAEPVQNLNVDYRALEEETVFEDSLEDGTAEPGYVTDEDPDGVNSWDVRSNGAYSGEYSWDFGDSDYQSVENGSLSWLNSPQITIPTDATSAQISFRQWRDFDYRYDGGNLKVSTDGTSWNLIEPENGYTGAISEEFDNPLAGEDAWIGMSRWTQVSFNLDQYIGETIQFNWSAGVDSWASDEDGWRIDDIKVTAERPYTNPGSNDDNRLTWDASPDDGSGQNNVERYNIYRSEDEAELGELISSVKADGSASYRYFDKDAGTSDNKTWVYTLKAEITDGTENLEGGSAKEPLAPYPQNSPTPAVRSAVSVGQHDTIELSVVAAHSSPDKSMNISFYSGKTDNLIGEVHDVYSGETVSVVWNEFLPEGDYSWYVTIDDGDHLVKNDEWIFTLDNSDPQVEILAPSYNEIVNTSDVTLSWNGQDDVSSIDYYEIRVRNELDWTIVEDKEEVVIGNMPEGKNFIDVRAYDKAGNQIVETVEATVDTSKPNLEITKPQSGGEVNTDEITLEWNGKDDITNIEKYEVRLNGGILKNVGLNEYFTLKGLKQGYNTINVSATDSANNVYVASIQVLYDSTNPNVNVTSIEDGDILTEDQLKLEWKGEVTWKKDKNISEVVQYETGIDSKGWIDHDYQQPEPPAQGGNMVWQHDYHDDYVYSVYESNGVVYSGSWDNTVMAFDYEEDKILWRHEHHDSSVAYVVEHNGVVYSGAYDGKVVAADASDGSLIWEHTHHNRAVYSVDVADGVVYSGSGDSTVIAADASNGSLIWQHEHHSSGFGVFSVHVSDGVVYSGSIIDNLVVAADAETGELIWQHDHHSGMVYSVFEYNGVVYSGSGGGWGNPGQVIAADADNGSFLWKHELHESMVYSVHVADGIVYSGSNDERVIAADAETGEKLWEHHHHDHFVYSVFESDGVLYSGSGDGTVAAVRAEDEEPAETPELSQTYNNLEDGEHTAYIRTTNKAGTQYVKTINFTVDTPDASLDIVEPTDGIEQLTYQQEFSIEGQTGTNSSVYINGEEIAVSEDGSFVYNSSLIEGQNIFEVRAENQAGDSIETTVYALYLPQIPEIQSEIDTLQTEITENRETINDLENATNNLRLNMTTLEEEFNSKINNLKNSLDENVTDLEEAIQNNRAEMVNKIEENITNIESSLNDLQTDINDIHSGLNDINDTISELDLDLQDTNNRLNETNESLNEHVVDLQDQIDNLNTNLDDKTQSIQSTIQTIQTDLDDYKSEQKDVNSDHKDDISMSKNLGIAGIILAIISIIIAVVALNKIMQKGDEPEIEEEQEEQVEIEEEDNPFE